MTFTSSIFLIGLLPWFIILNKLISTKKTSIRIVLFFLANCLFLVWGGIGSFLLLSTFAALVWLLGTVLFKAKNKWTLTVSLILSLTPLIIIKYSIFIINTINSAIGCHFATPSIVVPIGISFVTFEAVSFLVDIYKGKIEKCPNLIRVYLYLTFFPTITSGPIIRYKEFENGLDTKTVSCDYATSIERIVIGLCKKTLVADKLALIADYYFNGIGAGNNYSPAGLWIGSIAYTLQLYYDFSGYSDMAIGIGQLLGFSLRENFNKPYLASNISDFWKRWHISLTQWFRDYIYIPLGGNRCSVLRHICNMLVVWLITGVWHGADWTFIIWGLIYFILLVAEKYIPILKKIGTGIIGHIYTLFFVNLLWVLFRANNLSSAFRYIAGMFGGGSSLLEEKAVRFLPLIGLAALLCISWNRCISRFSEKKWFSVLKGMILLVLFGLALCAAINSTYAPYIYGSF